MKNFKGSSIYSAILILIASAFLVYAHDDGMKGRTRKSETKQGCTCHGDDPSPSVIVAISGPDILAPEQEADYTVTVSGGPLANAGVDIAVTKGTLTPTDPDLKLLSGELTHKDPKKPTGNSVQFQFKYKAPSTPGEETMYANGNSSNGNDKKTGDSWNFAPDKKITVKK